MIKVFVLLSGVVYEGATVSGVTTDEDVAKLWVKELEARLDDDDKDWLYFSYTECEICNDFSAQLKRFTSPQDREEESVAQQT